MLISYFAIPASATFAQKLYNGTIMMVQVVRQMLQLIFSHNVFYMIVVVHHLLYNCDVECYE